MKTNTYSVFEQKDKIYLVSKRMKELEQRATINTINKKTTRHGKNLDRQQ